MMPALGFNWHLAVLGLILAGFVLLALASERESKVLLRRPPTARERRLFRWLGWPLLGLSFGFCIWAWKPSFGTVLWFGWLSVAAVALVFGIAYLPWRELRKSHGRPQKKRDSPECRPPVSGFSRSIRRFGYMLLLLIPLAFGWALSSAKNKPTAAAMTSVPGAVSIFR